MARLKAHLSQFKRADVLKVRRRVLLTHWKDQPVLKKWPPPRGKTYSDLQQAWVDDFSQKARLLKSVNPQLLIAAQNLAKGTGWYYRDVLERAAAGKLITDGEEYKITTPTACFFSTSNTTLPTNVTTRIKFQGQYWDNNVFRHPTDDTKVVFKSAGLYLIMADLWMAVASGTNPVLGRILHENGHFIASGQWTQVGLLPSLFSMSAIWYFHANETLGVTLQKNNSGNQVAVQHLTVLGITPEIIIP